MAPSQFVGQIYWLDDLADTCSTNLTIICSNGDYHGISLAAFVSAFKFLKKDLCNLTNDYSEDLFISCDLNHDLVEQLCNFVGTGTIHISDLNLKHSMENVLRSLGFSFSLTVSDNVAMIKQEIIFEKEDENFKQEDILEEEETNEGKIEFKKNEEMSDFMKELPDFKVPENQTDIPLKRKSVVKTPRRKRKKNSRSEGSERTVISKTERKNSITVINMCREKPGLKVNCNNSDESKTNLITCELCGMVLNGWFNASLHLSTHIGIKALQCGICEKVLDTKQKYHRHIYSGHREKLACEVCGLVLVNSRVLKAHIRNKHSNRKKEHQCEVCKEFFMTKGNLSLHMRRHSDERKYSCEYCGLAYKGKDDLGRHILAIHERSKLKHICSECGKGFLTPNRLEIHKRTHTGEKPFGCEYCGKRFHNIGIMKSHVKLVHERKFMFGCRECSMKFVKKEAIIHHAVTHTSLSPFKCSACKIGFRHREAVRRHINKEHLGINVKLIKPSEEEKKYLLSFLVELKDEGDERDGYV